MNSKKSNNSKNKNELSVYLDPKFVPADLQKFCKDLKQNQLDEKSFLKKSNEINVFLTNFDLDKLQMNFFLLLIGKRLYNFCDTGNYNLEIHGGDELQKSNIILGWELEKYKFQKFKTVTTKEITKSLNLIPKDIKNKKEAYFFIRDLINSPANILGPNEIYHAAKEHLNDDYVCKKITGKKLEKTFPLISVVGAGASKKNKPIFASFTSKTKKKRKIFIIGKGVSFDTGGLNLKTGVGMSLMKKDMGGAANAIGLAKLLSKKKLNAEVNLLLCLVENSVSDNAMRPSDIYKSRSGEYIEVSDTDAEGRLIMADALTYASEKNPELIIDLATLTGASRVAMGLEVPSFFSNNITLSNLLNKASTETGDPLWQLPLWQNYNNQILSNHADYKNIGSSSFGGAITAALFLEKFIKKEIPWIHIDLMGWTKPNKYSRYEGGEAMGIIALSKMIDDMFK